MLLGNGLGRWKTIPIRRRRSTGSTEAPNTDSPSKAMSPLCRVCGSSSWSRLIERRKVDFPQPDGPISAVTALGFASMLMSKSACVAPYQKEKSFAASVPMRRTVPPGVMRSLRRGGHPNRPVMYASVWALSGAVNIRLVGPTSISSPR